MNTEFPTPGIHVKGTKVALVTGVTGTVVRYAPGASRRGGKYGTDVLVRSDLDGIERWYHREGLTVVREA